MVIASTAVGILSLEDRPAHVSKWPASSGHESRTSLSTFSFVFQCLLSVSVWLVGRSLRALSKAWSSQKQNRWRMHAQQKPHPMQTKRQLGGAAKVQALQGFGRSSAKQSGRGIRKKENEGLLRACMHISWVQSV